MHMSYSILELASHLFRRILWFVLVFLFNRLVRQLRSVPLRDLSLVLLVCPGCRISLADEDFVANLVIIPLDMFNVILGMDWLSQYQAIISYFWKTISLQAPSGREVVF